MRQSKDALVGIVSLLRKQEIPFVITGGLAAPVYGSKRPLVDIDIDIPERFLPGLFPLMKIKSYSDLVASLMMNGMCQW